MQSQTLRVGHRVKVTSAEGPHDRFALWVSGCTLRCPGCCNPELFVANAEQETPLLAVFAEILESKRLFQIEGVTFLGGEPFEQAAALAELARLCVQAELGVIVFTGYEVQRARALPSGEELWQASDTVVDGPFDRAQLEPTSRAGGRRFIGSTNQQLHHRSARYAQPELWSGPRTMEVQLDAAQTGYHAHGQPDFLRDIVHLAALQRVSKH